MILTLVAIAVGSMGSAFTWWLIKRRLYTEGISVVDLILFEVNFGNLVFNIVSLILKLTGVWPS